MKALTLWQPWASLWACGAKRFETRGRAIHYRGPIAIHAAALPVMEALRRMFGEDEQAKRAFMLAAEDALGYKSMDEMVDDLPLGAVLATGEMVGCHRMIMSEAWKQAGISCQTNKIWLPSKKEQLFGGWTPGRYAVEFANMKMLDEPVPAKGKQGLWNWEGAP